MKKGSTRFFIIGSVFLVSCFSAWGGKTDSLRAVYHAATSDTSRIRLLHELYVVSDSIHYAEENLRLSKRTGNNAGIAQSYLDIGRHYYFSGKQDQALSYLMQSVQLASSLGKKKMLSSAYRYIGYIYRPHDPFTAEDYYKKSLRMAEETGDELSASYLYSAIGNIYEGIFDGPTDHNKIALENYLKSLAIRERVGSPEEIASSLNETSRIYDILGQYDKVFELRKRGLEIAERSGSLENMIYLNTVLGNDYSERLHDYKTGLAYQLRAWDLARSRTSDVEMMFDISKGIAGSYHHLGDFKRSNEFFRLCVLYNDSMRGKRNNYDYNLSAIKHDLEKELDQQKALLTEMELKKERAEAERQTTLRNAFIIGFIVVLALALLILRVNRQKLRANRELDLKNKKIEYAYQSLAASESRFKQITETIDDVFYLYNIIEKKYEYISPNCAAMFGLDAEQFYAGKSSEAEVYHEDKPIVKEATGKLYSGIPYDIEYRMVVNGKIKWIAEKSSPVFDKRGILVRNSGICRDATQRKINEEKIKVAYETLAVSESKFKTITETIDDVFYLYNIEEQKYEYISPNCVAMFGYEPTFFYSGGSGKVVVHERDLQLVREANEKVDSGMAYDIEYRMVVDGKIKWIAEKSSPIYDASGKLVRNSGILRDISQRKVSEEVLQDKNRDIMESILVARTIQNAILVPREKMKERMEDFFILSKPRDIVSGDFYFYKETKNGIFISAADCTGHGVPGGFMSMIGHAYLNEIVKADENKTPAAVLDELREMIIKALNQDATTITNQDGMDIALLFLEKDGRTIQYAGAFNPLYIVSSDELEEVSGDPFPIGMQIVGQPSPFTNHRLELKKGDAIYIFSDGYADQFGGPKGRKFMKRQMQELLLSISDKSMEEQGKILDVALNDWKGGLEQVDDILVIGIRV